MGDMRYMNWAPAGEGVEIENAGDLAGGGQQELRRLAEKTGATLNIVLGRGGSGRNLFLCLPAIEDDGILTILGSDVLTVEDLRDWSTNFSFQIDVKATPSDVARETTHLVLIDDISSGTNFGALVEHLPELPNLQQITFVPPFNRNKGLAVPAWIDECTFVESVHKSSDSITWSLITTQSFPERITRTISADNVVNGFQRWKPSEFFRNLNEGSQAHRNNWSWSDFSDVTDSLIMSEVHHPNAFDDSHLTIMDSPLPVVAAAVEREVNERMFGMWGEPASQDTLFVRVSANSRPLMILARMLTPLALRCSLTGENPELKTLFGVGEFLYPRVQAEVEKRLKAEGMRESA